MRHLLLISLSAFLTLPFAVVAEEEDTQERDTYTYEREASDDQTETTFERTSDPQSEEAAAEESEYSFEQTGERTETTFEEEGAAEGEDVTREEVSFEEQEASEQDQSEMDSERTRSTTVGFDQQDQQQRGQSDQGGEPEVARSQFASDVQNREPVDEVSDSFSASEDPLYFFTEIDNGEGETITHRWKHDGEVMAEVPLQVGGDDSWRTWSSKQLMPDWDGEWTVEVVDSQGNVLEEKSVRVEGGQQMQNVGFEQESDSDQQQDQSAEFEQTSGQQQDTEYEVERTEGQDETEYEFERTEGQEQEVEVEEVEGEEQQDDDWWQTSDDQQQDDQQQDDAQDTEERDW